MWLPSLANCKSEYGNRMCSACGDVKTRNPDTMHDKKRFRWCLGLTVVVFVAGVLYLGYFCPSRICAFSTGTTVPTVTDMSTAISILKSKVKHFKNVTQALNIPPHCNIDHSAELLSIDNYLNGKIMHQNHSISDIEKDYEFDIDNDHDVLVFLHMQKTGGTTFGRHLVRNIQLSKPCVCYKGQKRCDCLNHKNHVWLFSRYSTGWRCGLHADWTELTTCANDVLDKLDKNERYRRFLYITFLRDPYSRYLSEYKHVQRGATWKSARLQCNGRQATLEEVPFCFDGEDWSGVNLDNFINCPHNLAINRQTRMLANLSMSGCYDENSMTKDKKDCIMLQSAKENLQKMAFFGLMEYQKESQFMFEQTFGLKFIEDFFQYNKTHSSKVEVNQKQKNNIVELIKLDIELYQYAKDLFFQRLNHLKNKDSVKKKFVDNRRNNLVPPFYTDDYFEDEDNTAEDDATNDRINKLWSKLSK